MAPCRRRGRAGRFQFAHGWQEVNVCRNRYLSGAAIRWCIPRMKCVVVIVRVMFVGCCLGGSSAWAIDCLSAPGDPRTGWYSWREIDGRKCWFQKTGAMPAKSQLHWPARVGQEARSIEPTSPSKAPPAQERTEPEAAAPPSPPPADTANRPEPQPPTLPRFRTARVKPATGASLPLGNGLDLMSGASLSAMQPLGGVRRKPAGRAPADPFDARFTGRSD
jgi:hypothetical protein